MPIDSSTIDSSTTDSSTAVDSSTSDSSTAVDSSTPDAAPACVDLKVKNYIAWCSFTVNGGAASIAEEDTVCVPPGTVTLAATARATFELGADPWHDVNGDTGSGVAGARTSPGG
ncbi:MAG TPA: hypothetical protein VH044_06750, partial [Polyangiaceae bacterium]|nr:hypothetical protein [Polyangiaceae bacterium]